MALTYVFGTADPGAGMWQIPKGLSVRVGKITLDGAYPAGGWAIIPDNLNLQTQILALVPAQVSGFVLVWDDANKKLKAYKTGAAVSTALAEAAVNEAGLNGLIASFVAFGF